MLAYINSNLKDQILELLVIKEEKRITDVT